MTHTTRPPGSPSAATASASDLTSLLSAAKASKPTTSWPCAAQPLGHVAAHLPESDHAELHASPISSSVVERHARGPQAAVAQRREVAGRLRLDERRRTCTARRGCRRRRRGRRSTTWTNTPVGGPPLWSWPVECRKRGPSPTVVATRSRSRSATRARSTVVDDAAAGIDVGVDGDVVARRRPARARPTAAARGCRAPRPTSSTACVAALAAATSGWSNGLMPRPAPHSAVATSHSSTCGAELGRRGRRRPRRTAPRRRGGRRRRARRAPARSASVELADDDEQPVVAVDLGRPERLARRRAARPCRACRSTRR